MVEFSTDAMRARFKANRAEREAILAKSGPLRATRDQLDQEHRAKINGLDAEIKAAEAGLFDLDNEAGALVRALGGKTEA